MTAIKPTSTNQRNVRQLVVGCPMTYTFTLLGTRWKPIILWKVRDGCGTVAELHRAIPLITRKMLFQDLRELATRGLVEREPKPPGTRCAGRYKLTPLGESLHPILAEMMRWGERHRPKPGDKECS